MSQSQYSLITNTDKSFWHGYIEFYESHLPTTIGGLVVEFGVFKGHSIQWWSDKYPQARIIGVDILPTQPQWPRNARIEYRRLDQGNEGQVAAFFKEIEEPSLIIEDGSHIPSHQSRCLKHGMNKLAPGGVYIVEDIHTSHPSHSYFKAEFRSNPSTMQSPSRQTSLSLLLALEHIRRTGRAGLTEEELSVLANGTHFTREEVLTLNSQIQSIRVYKRATLPLACYACGRTTFDYYNFKCICGVDLLSEADSMSILIVKSQMSEKG